MLGLYGGFHPNIDSEILTTERIADILETNYDSVTALNDSILQRVYGRIRPKLEDGKQVERKDMSNPKGLSENLNSTDLATYLLHLGVLTDRFPQALDNHQNIRFVINGATQLGCEQRINFVTKYLQNNTYLDFSKIKIDLATGERKLWPDGIGTETKKPDALLVSLLAARTKKSDTEITEIICSLRKKAISEITGNSEYDVDSFDPKQNSNLRGLLIQSIDSYFKSLDENFQYPDESEMFDLLAKNKLTPLGIDFHNIITHGGQADPKQGRATGRTGLKALANNLNNESGSSVLDKAELIVVAGLSHAFRFTSILTEELQQLGCSHQFNLQPAGPAFKTEDFRNAQAAQNLLNLTEAILGAVNFEIEKQKRIFLPGETRPQIINNFDNREDLFNPNRASDNIQKDGNSSNLAKLA